MINVIAIYFIVRGFVSANASSGSGMSDLLGKLLPVAIAGLIIFDLVYLYWINKKQKE
ncbi:hypothetical protein ACFLVP_00915 [Chloroflexota bacterium]